MADVNQDGQGTLVIRRLVCIWNRNYSIVVVTVVVVIVVVV